MVRPMLAVDVSNNLSKYMGKHILQADFKETIAKYRLI